MFDAVNTKLSHGQLIVRNFTEESNSTTADAFSNALVDTALHAAPATTSGTESSSSFSGDVTMTIRKSHHSISVNSNKECRASGSSDDAGTGESGHVVTAAGASTQTGMTTSSGEDGDSSGRCVGFGSGSSESSNASSLFDVANGNHRYRYHNHHRSQQGNVAMDAGAAVKETRRRADDGSSLRLTGDDAFDRFGMGPATVVASIIPPPNADANSSSGSGGEKEEGGLLPRHREPGYHTIRKTFSRLPKRSGSNSYRQRTETSSSEEQRVEKFIRGKYGYPKSGGTSMNANKKKARSSALKIKEDSIPRRPSSSSYCQDSHEANGGGSSSGSGTEGGYMGSADSKENESSSSPSVSSSEELGRKKSKKLRSFKGGSKIRTAIFKTHEEQAEESGDSSSSEIADFSSGTTSENGDEIEPRRYKMDRFHSTSPSLSSSNEDEGGSSEDGYEATYLQARNQILQGQQDVIEAATRKRKSLAGRTRLMKRGSWYRPQIQAESDARGFTHHFAHSPIMTLGSDIMAHVLTFLPPPIILDVLTMPLSKEWRQSFTLQPELWRVLCLVEPFKAEIDDREGQDIEDSCSEDSFGTLGEDAEEKESPLLEKYRLLYTSFVRCMKYLAQIREDALNGKAPSYIDYGIVGSNTQHELMSNNRNLQSFLAKARKSQGELSSTESSSSEEPRLVVAGVASFPPKETTRKRKRNKDRPQKEKKPKIGNSMITDRLLGPSASGDPGNLHLPWSCAIYSIVNWMVSFSDVEGIQVRIHT